MNGHDLNLNILYVLNPRYRLKKDKNRVLFINKANDPVLDDFLGFIHPVYAVILSFFNGELPLGKILEEVGKLLKKNRDTILKTVLPLIENSDELFFKFEGYPHRFPAGVLIKKTAVLEYDEYDPEIFFISKGDLDMESWRANSPLDAIYVANSRCFTDCTYCYADRQEIVDCQIPFGRIKELIKEAKDLEMRSFDISGGELFLVKEWYEILEELIKNGFSPYLSTKCPLESGIINKLKDLGIKRIQISIDSIVKEELSRMLHVSPGYRDKIVETLKSLDENDFEIYTNTQIISINQDKITGLIDFLLSLKNIKRINVGAAGFSLYKGVENFSRHKPNLAKIKKIEGWINQLKSNFGDKISLNFSGYIEKSELVDKKEEDKKRDFLKRARCSANFFGFVILPDGMVTICEELYRHPQFIIGDLKKQSIEEVWNSERAFELYRISREMIRSNSKCSTCDEFEKCRSTLGVCWKEVLYAYGYENWDYPDPKCPYAPKPFIEYYL